MKRKRGQKKEAQKQGNRNGKVKRGSQIENHGGGVIYI